MIAPIFYGIIGSAGVALAMAVAGAGAASRKDQWLWLTVIAVALALVQWTHSRRKTTPAEVELDHYDGVPELLIHLHSPALPDHSMRWGLRGLLSWILSSLGFPVGPEGGASEIVQAVAMKSRSTALRWSDLVRRSDAAMALSAGISAAFGTPFAAVLVSSELAIGGRVLSSVLASLSAYLSMGYFSKLFAQVGIPVLGFRDHLTHLWGFRLLDWREWVIAGGVVLGVSMLASVSLMGLRQVRGWVEALTSRKSYAMTLVAAVLLGSLVLLTPELFAPLPSLFEELMRGEWGFAQRLSLIGFLFLTLLAMGSGFGSMGVWWPTVLLGAALASVVLEPVPPTLLPRGLIPNAALLGAVAFGAVWLRTPISLAVLAFEVTQNGSLLLPCLLAATLARWVDRKMGQTAWFDQLLESKGFPIQEGRAVAVLESLRVRDAMVTNFETVTEMDSVRSCHEAIRSCHYPFLPVLDSRGLFKGLLTVDLIEEGLFSHLPSQGSRDHAHEKLSGLLEAKDLLYRSGIQSKAVHQDLSLEKVGDLLRGQICLAVVDDHGCVVGLLFAHDVRQCYDREVARRSFVVQANQNALAYGK